MWQNLISVPIVAVILGDASQIHPSAQTRRLSQGKMAENKLQEEVLS